ncbi:KilA domain-containing protein [[Pasteurella] aerogenes]|nr:KilA domain-containing protein [[Pasteurella] aerogenes]
MTNLQILSNSIRTLNNLYSLNDLHKASGNDPKHRPTYFIKNDQTQELIAELDRENSQCENSHTALNVINGGLNRGTYACEELVLAYAMWISPKFHLVVLRAFLAMHKQQNQPQQLALPEPEPTIILELTQSEVRKLINVWMLFTRFAESVQFLLNKVKPFIVGHLYSSPELNLMWTRQAIKDTQPLIKKLMDTLPKKQPLHYNRDKLQRYSDF